MVGWSVGRWVSCRWSVGRCSVGRWSADFIKPRENIMKVPIATRSLSTNWFLVSIRLANVLRNYTKPGKHIETGTSKFTTLSPLGPHVYLHRIDTSGAKIRSVLKKFMTFIS